MINLSQYYSQFYGLLYVYFNHAIKWQRPSFTLSCRLQYVVAHIGAGNMHDSIELVRKFFSRALLAMSSHRAYMIL